MGRKVEKLVYCDYCPLPTGGDTSSELTDSCSASHLSAHSAAAQPLPADVIAWR